jgi:transposase
MSNFREFDRETGFLLPPSLDEWLPEQHLARFVVEVVDGLDLSAMVKSYRGTGSAGYHPALLLGLLVYGYATGVFSSRKLERASYDSVAFRFIAANDHPDHDTIATAALSQGHRRSVCAGAGVGARDGPAQVRDGGA